MSGEDSKLQRTPRGVRATQVVLLFAATSLFVAHLLRLDVWQVDWITLALLGIMLAIPLVDLVRKVKWGDFEAEIGREEVERAQARVSVEVGPGAPGVEGEYEQRLMELLSEDPRLALARVRMDIEESLKRLDEAAIGDSEDLRRLSLGRIVDRLVRAETLTPAVAGALREVIALANRAVHGEYVNPAIAEDLAMLGARLVEELRLIYADAVSQPAQREPITSEQVEFYSGLRYRVRTVVPLVEEPYMNVYEVDQAGLDSLLDGYGEYAEFLIEVTPLPDAVGA
jgi:hypothetical protein